MQFEYDNDQSQLQNSLRRLLQAQAPFEQRRRHVAGEAGWNTALWPALAELGVTALALPEVHGGFGARPIGWLPVMQELGRSLAVQPFLATAVLAATAISRGGSAAQCEALLPAIAQGSRIVAFAHDEAGARHRPGWIETRARSAGGQWLLDGVKSHVPFGADADTLVVSALGEHGETMLFLLAADQPGVRRERLQLVDDTPAARIGLQSALGEPLAGDAAAALGAAQDAGLAAACAEALGVAECAYALTTEYVRTRQQFGRAIGSNQAVRHRVAEMHVALDMLRSAAMGALLALEIGDVEERARELSRAKMLVARHGIFIAQQGIQLHGGIGMTTEYAVGHCLRRMTVLDMGFGDGAMHAARLGMSLASASAGPSSTSRA